MSIGINIKVFFYNNQVLKNLILEKFNSNKPVFCISIIITKKII